MPSACDQATDGRQALILFAQADDLVFELAKQSRHVLERTQHALQCRTAPRTAQAEAPPPRRQLGPALACDAIVVRRHRALLATGLRSQPTERFGAADLLIGDHLFYLFEDLRADAAASCA